MDSTWGPGRVIAGRYRLAELLGQGGMGSVWKADHLTLRSPVAVKLIDPDIADRAEMLDRFQREAQAAATLRSPHVVQILDYGVDDGVPYIVMELLEGESLASRLERVKRLSQVETARFVTHVARALGRAHEAGIVHRDLKPDNVFLVRNDDQEVGKVLDFGIAKHGGLGSGKGPTRTGNILGTPGYMSPEQAQGTKAVDARSDLWSLGVIAYECLVGEVPFESPALGDLLLKICVHPLPVPSEHGAVPAGFDAWFARACCRDIDQRFQSAKDLADALRAILVPDLSERSSTAIPVPSSGGALGVSSGVAAVTAVAGAPTQIAASAPTMEAPGRAHGGTVPGMSLPLAAAPKRSVVPIVAALALGGLAVGAVATWLVVSRGHGPAPALAAVKPVPSATAITEPGGAAAAPVVTAAAPTVVPSATVEAAAETASPQATAAPSAKPRAGGGRAATVPAAARNTQVAPPAPKGGSDNRLGF